MAVEKEKLRSDLKRSREILDQYDDVLAALKDTDVDTVPLRRKISKLKSAVNATEEAIKRLP